MVHGETGGDYDGADVRECVAQLLLDVTGYLAIGVQCAWGRDHLNLGAGKRQCARERNKQSKDDPSLRKFPDPQGVGAQK